MNKVNHIWESDKKFICLNLRNYTRWDNVTVFPHVQKLLKSLLSARAYLKLSWMEDMVKDYPCSFHIQAVFSQGKVFKGMASVISLKEVMRVGFSWGWECLYSESNRPERPFSQVRKHWEVNSLKRDEGSPPNNLAMLIAWPQTPNCNNSDTGISVFLTTLHSMMCYSSQSWWSHLEANTICVSPLMMWNMRVFCLIKRSKSKTQFSFKNSALFL